MRAAEQIQLASLRHLFYLIGYGRIVAHLRNFIFDLRKNNSRWVGLGTSLLLTFKAAGSSNSSALCQAKWLRVFLAQSLSCLLGGDMLLCCGESEGR